MYGQYLDRSLPILPAFYRLIRYGDSNFARDPKDKKSVIEYYFFLNDTIVLWSSKKQRTILTLMTEVEYIAIGYAAREKI